MMDLEVVGRHALFFDDDSAAAFVNSGEALVEWNSLLIDRYDVRHLLESPPQPRKRYPIGPETQIDHERYLDWKPETQQQESDVGASSVELGGYHSVAFSYGSAVDSNDQKNYNDGMGDSGFRPPFPIPESLLQCLPPTEKLHQIIARTALFVSKNGGQSEIVLRVKQGDNPTFGFLMPDHHLHPYFRYLIDHQDLLKSDMVGNFENKDDPEKTSGALSLLGSVYGSGDDEDTAIENFSGSKENESRKNVDASVSSNGHGSQETGILAKENEKDEAMSKHSSSGKENSQVLKKNSLVKVSKAGIPTGKKKEPHSTLPSATSNKPLSSAFVNASTAESVILEPPSDIKKLVDRVVEFILKNGPQFEAVLTEQDSKYGRFPFLLRSNQFNSYYVNVLRKAQESKLSDKSCLYKKDDQMVSRLEKKSSLGNQSDSLSLGPASGDIPYDCDRKEKFKMVLGKSKKDGDEPSSTVSPSPYGFTIDAAQTAAILQAATRGVKNSHFVPNISLNGEIRNEAEAHMTKEQKLKAERLKRAKMFLLMLKSGAAPSKSETPRALSMEPLESVVSGKEREDSPFSLHVETSVTKDEFEKKLSDNEIHDRISRRKYRSKSSRYDGDEEKDEIEVEEEGEKVNNEKLFRKKRQSHRSSCEIGKEVEEDEEDKDHRYGKKKHRSHRSSRESDIEEDKEDRDYRHGKRKHKSHRSSRDNGQEEEVDDDAEDRYNRHRKHPSHRSSHEIGDEEEEEEEEKEKEEDRDHRHGNRKHRSHRSSHEIGDEEEEDRDHRYGNRKHRSHRSSRETDIKEDEDDREYRRRGKRKHRSHRSSHKDEKEERDDERDYKKGHKKHQSHHSSDEDDEEDDDYEEMHDKQHSKKKHRSHHSSRRSNDKQKHREQRSSSRNNSWDDENHPKSSSEKCRNTFQSVEDLEEGEISSKSSDKSRGSVGGGANREASIDVLSSYRDGRAPSQPSEATEVPDDLRAKIRAMLMANF